MNHHIPNVEHTICHDWVRHRHSRRGNRRTGSSHGLRRLYIVSESFVEEYNIKMAIYLGNRLRNLLVNNRDILILGFVGTILNRFGALNVTVMYSRNNTSVFRCSQDILNIFTLGVNAPIMLRSG